MTDRRTHQSNRSDTATHQARNDSDNIEFEYPQLLLEASLHSLLTHSYSSGSDTVRNMSVSSNTLSRSWASISEIDFSQDEDLHSDNTDTGSLIDASSIQDIHSVNDSGEISETEEQDEPLTARRSSHITHSEIFERGYDLINRHDRETHGLERSADTVSINAGSDLEQDKLQSSTGSIASTESSFDDEMLARSFILPTNTFGVSTYTSNFDLKDRPLRLLYLETDSVEIDQKAAVLRKIGAALITHGPSHGPSHTSSSNYHVIPSEFGPGARPDTSELIPVTKQMSVYECNLPHSGFTDDFPNNLSLRDGTPVLCSNKGILITKHNQPIHRPDLILFLMSERDSKMAKSSAIEAVTYLEKFDTPILVLEERSPHFVPKIRGDMLDADHPSSSRTAPYEMPLSIQQFLATNADDLNKHLSLLVESKHQLTKSTTVRSLIDVVRNIGSGCMTFVKKIRTRKTAVSHPQGHHGVTQIEAVPRMILSKARNFWPSFDVRRATTLLLVISVPFMFTAIFGMWHSVRSPVDTANTPSLSSIRTDPTPSLSVLRSTNTPKMKDASTTPMSKDTDVSLLSGVLQDVAEYWPTHRSSRVASKEQIKVPDKQESRSHSGKECGVSATLVNLRRGGVLDVPANFYQEGKAAFSVNLMRGKRSVPFKIENRSLGRLSIKVHNNQLYGSLKLLLSTPYKSAPNICTHIDLRDTPFEKLAAIIERTHKRRDDNQEASSSTEWTLVRIRKHDSERSSLLRGVTQFTVSSIESAHATFEDAAVTQIVACYQNANECWSHKAKKYEKQLTGMAQKFEERLTTSARRIRDRASVLADRVVIRTCSSWNTIRRSQPGMQDAVSKVRTSQRKLMTELTANAAKAQRHARRLMKVQRQR